MQVGTTIDNVRARDIKGGDRVIIPVQSDSNQKQFRLFSVAAVSRFEFDARELSNQRGRFVQPAATFILFHLETSAGARPMQAQMAEDAEVLRVRKDEPVDNRSRDDGTTPTGVR